MCHRAAAPPGRPQHQQTPHRGISPVLDPANLFHKGNVILALDATPESLAARTLPVPVRR
jgi:hypothetical protein